MTVARQILAVQTLELRKRFLGKRAIPVYLLALIPLVMFSGRYAAAQIFHWNVNASLAQDQVMYAVLFRTLILRFVVYFGCVAVFVPLFRGDILGRSLHYYFLVPMKRRPLTAAKYLSDGDPRSGQAECRWFLVDCGKGNQKDSVPCWFRSSLPNSSESDNPTWPYRKGSGSSISDS
jgi:hypothetical protein